MRRIFNTGDLYDFDLSHSQDDTIVIEKNRATLYVNQDPSDTNAPFVSNKIDAITINTYKGALSSLVTSATAMAAIISAYAF